MDLYVRRPPKMNATMFVVTEADVLAKFLAFAKEQFGEKALLTRDEWVEAFQDFRRNHYIPLEEKCQTQEA